MNLRFVVRTGEHQAAPKVRQKLARGQARSEAGHAAPTLLSAARRTIADGETAVQEARTAMNEGDYRRAIDRSRSAAASLQGTTRDLDAVPTSGTRKRR